jgi:hypothetical protein
MASNLNLGSQEAIDQLVLLLTMLFLITQFLNCIITAQY